MNKHFYRVIFNKALGLWQCVSELAKTAGKSKSLKAVVVATALAMSGASFAADYELNDGTTKLMAESASLNGEVIITNPRSIFMSSEQIQFGSPDSNGNSKITNATISNQAQVQANKAMIIANSDNATINVDNATMVAYDEFHVGYQKTGILNATNGSNITATNLFVVGSKENSKGSVNLSGKNTTLNVNKGSTHDGNVHIGVLGTGTLNVTNQSTVNIEGLLSVGSGNTGTLSIDQATINAGQITVGLSKNVQGHLNANHSTINAQDLLIGHEGIANATLNNSTIELTGVFSTADNNIGSQTSVSSNDNRIISNLFSVGSLGESTLNSKNDIIYANATIKIGQDANSKGIATFDNSYLNTQKFAIADKPNSVGEMALKNGSHLEVTEYASVGNGGQGKLTIKTEKGDQTKARFNTPKLVIGDMQGIESNGRGTVDLIDLSDKDTLTILSADTVILGNNTNTVGTLNISGIRAKLNTNDIVVGNKGTGTLELTNTNMNSVKSFIVANQTDSQGELILNSDSSASSLTSISTDNFILANQGHAKLTSSQGSISSKNNLIIANDTDSSANINMTKGGLSSNQNIIIANGSNSQVNMNLMDSTLWSDQDIHISTGKGSQSNIILNAGNLYAFNGTISLATAEQSKTTLTLNSENMQPTDSNSIVAKTIIVGKKGQATVDVKNKQSYYLHNSIQADKMYIGGYGEQSENAVGVLSVTNSNINNIKEFIVGNTGSGTLKFLNTQPNEDVYSLELKQISRNPNSKLSEVYFDGITLEFKDDQNNLFAGFTKDNKIEIGQYGLGLDTNVKVYDTTAQQLTDKISHVIINPNAVITGNTGRYSLSRETGGFIKYGKGTLEISENSKQFTGDIGVLGGLLKINGNYTMNGENLLIGIIDENDDKTLDTTSEYGKLEVTGTADISNGYLQVLADDIAKILITKDNPTEEFKDIVKAGTLKGRFKDVSVVNSVYGTPIDTTLTADYRDEQDGRVHLAFKPQNPTVQPQPQPQPQPPVVPSSIATFTDAVKSQNNTSAENIAKVLDKSITTSGNLLGETLKLTTSRLTQAELSQYANELQPLMLGTTGQLFNQNQAIFAQAVQEQTLSPSRHLWAKAIIRDGELQSSSHVNGYDDRHYGAIIGADTAVTSKLNLGVALAYVDSQAKTHNIQQKMTSDHIQGLIYGNYQAGENTLLNFHAGIGQVDIHGERHINVPRLDALTTAQSDYKANTTQAGIGVQHRIGSEQQYVEPFAQFDYRQVSSKAYQETGSNMFNLNVDKQRHEALRWTLGVRANQPLTQNLALTGFVSASLEQADNPTVQASFKQFSNEKFATTGQTLGQEIGSAGFGLRYYPSKMTEVSAIYQGEWRKYYKQQGGLLEFKMKF